MTSSPEKEVRMPPLGSPLRRKRLNTEDNIRVHHISSSALKKARINTLQNEQELREPSLRKAPSKATLSPVKFYETKLALSCETWSAFSISEGAYKRGWKPNRPAEFNGLVRLVVAGVFLDLLQEHPEVGKLPIRANRWLLAQEQRQSVRELQKLRLDREDSLIAENTIMPLRDLVAAMLISNSSELLGYAAVFVGYALVRLKEHAFALLDHPQPAVVGSFADGTALSEALVERANSELRQRFESTSVAGTTGALELASTPNELSQFFAELVGRHRGVVAMLQAREVVSAIRYQVGFKFYEDRTKRFASDRTHPPGHVVVSCRGRTNFGVVSLNRSLQLVLVLHDCKFSMAEVDITRIEDWFRSTSRPEGHSRQSRLLPLLKLLE